MFQQVTSVINFLLRGRCNKEESSEANYMRVKIIDYKTKDGEIQVNAIGPWVDKFKINQFQDMVLNNVNMELAIYYAEPETKSYYCYLVTKNPFSKKPNVVLEFSSEPFIDDCMHYLCFVFTVKTQILRNIFPKLREHVKNIADEYPEVAMSFIVSGQTDIWKEQEMYEKCTKMLSEAIGDVIKYSLNMNYRKKTFELLKIEDRYSAQIELYKKISQCLPYNKGNDG